MQPCAYKRSEMSSCENVASVDREYMSTKEIFIRTKGPKPETQLRRKYKLSQIKARKAIRARSNNACNVSEAASGVDFSVYKGNQINSLYQQHAWKVKNEVAPIKNPTTCLIPDKYRIQNASKEELAELKKNLPSKIRLRREVTEMPVANTSINFFASDDTAPSKVLASSTTPANFMSSYSVK